MKLEDQVCSLEHAKKLKELSIRQGSLFSWFDTEAFGLILERSDHTFALDHYLSVARIASAFTVAELGEMLPPMFSTIKTKENYWEWIVDEKPIWHRDFPSLSEADARAKLLIYLIENNLILGSSYK